ncbi:MAG: EamA family transporter RarD [Pseudomonadales bacterium]|nr:EamA family transporter RarD [Pseudomonadales bacterium]MCP5185920.1 EamA family transporter RarD [Pseudomonadales bacterium]
MGADERRGVLYGIIAYLIWGLAIPAYFMAVRFAGPLEVLAHRLVWSVALLAVLLVITRQLLVFRNLTSRQWGWLAISALLLSINWLVFVWAVFNDHMLDASLGYYINPLVTFLLGALVLDEQPSPLQWLAVGVAALGVGHELLVLGRVPWIALTLAVSFALYGLVRKRLGVPSVPGLAAETLWMFPAAVGYLLWHYTLAEPVPTGYTATEWLLLSVGGFVTVAPLLAFAAAALRVRLVILSFLQYLSPTLTFLLAVGVYGQVLLPGQLVTFGCIWLAVLIFTLGGRYHRQPDQMRESGQ